MSLAEGVIQLLDDSAKVNNFTCVKTVWLEIGQLAGVEATAGIELHQDGGGRGLFVAKKY